MRKDEGNLAIVGWRKYVPFRWRKRVRESVIFVLATPTLGSIENA